MVGQLSWKSPMPSRSRSSSSVLQLPLLLIPKRSQVSLAILMQLSLFGQSADVAQSLVAVMLQMPVVGQTELSTQVMLLVRLHDPVASSVFTGLVQSPSQASPSLSPSPS